MCNVNENVQCAVCVSGRLRKCVLVIWFHKWNHRVLRIHWISDMPLASITNKASFWSNFNSLRGQLLNSEVINVHFLGLLSLFVKIPPQKTFLINSYCSFCTGWCYLGGQRRAAPSSQLLPPAAGLPRLQKHHCKPTPQDQGCLRRCQPPSRRPACWLGLWIGQVRQIIYIILHITLFPI